jgi:hypothetical protein
MHVIRPTIQKEAEEIVKSPRLQLILFTRSQNVCQEKALQCKKRLRFLSDVSKEFPKIPCVHIDLDCFALETSDCFLFLETIPMWRLSREEVGCHDLGGDFFTLIPRMLSWYSNFDPNGDVKKQLSRINTRNRLFNEAFHRVSPSPYNFVQK